jgi:hypothetical protein
MGGGTWREGRSIRETSIGIPIDPREALRSKPPVRHDQSSIRLPRATPCMGRGGPAVFRRRRRGRRGHHAHLVGLKPTPLPAVIAGRKTRYRIDRVSNALSVIARSSCDEAIQGPWHAASRSAVAPGLLRLARNDGVGPFSPSGPAAGPYEKLEETSPETRRRACKNKRQWAYVPCGCGRSE